MKKYVFALISMMVAGVVLIVAGCGSSGGTGGTKPPDATKAVSSGSAGNNLFVTFNSFDGNMHRGKQDFTMTFVDQKGNTVDVGSTALNFRMPAMGSMAEMNAGAKLTKTDKPGVYRGVAEFSMVGDWEAQITYEGAAGKGSCSIPIVVK